MLSAIPQTLESKMATMISSGMDVVEFLKEQHDQIEAGFNTVLEAHGEDRKNAFFALRRLLAVHETAEEEIVHPAARKELTGGNLIVEARLQEEKEAKKVLAELEDHDVDSLEFEQQFLLLQSSVLLHAQAEEQQEFERLGDLLDQSRLDKMRRAVELAERLAPTRPHAGVESATANVLVGPFASMIDRARDAISGKS
jgi:hemerythrin superfamily protein